MPVTTKSKELPPVKKKLQDPTKPNRYLSKAEFVEKQRKQKADEAKVKTYAASLKKEKPEAPKAPAKPKPKAKAKAKSKK